MICGLSMGRWFEVIGKVLSAKLTLDKLFRRDDLLNKINLQLLQGQIYARCIGEYRWARNDRN
jgi:hypothetical protein